MSNEKIICIKFFFYQISIELRLFFIPIIFRIETCELFYLQNILIHDYDYHCYSQLVSVHQDLKKVLIVIYYWKYLCVLVTNNHKLHNIYLRHLLNFCFACINTINIYFFFIWIWKNYFEYVNNPLWFSID